MNKIKKTKMFEDKKREKQVLLAQEIILDNKKDQKRKKLLEKQELENDKKLEE